MKFAACMAVSFITFFFILFWFYFVLLYIWGKGEGCTGFWWGNLKERVHLGDPDVDGRIVLR
jgi:hypothetical protein